MQKLYFVSKMTMSFGLFLSILDFQNGIENYQNSENSHFQLKQPNETIWLFLPKSAPLPLLRFLLPSLPSYYNTACSLSPTAIKNPALNSLTARVENFFRPFFTKNTKLLTSKVKYGILNGFINGTPLKY